MNYCWRHKLLRSVTTTENAEVEIIDPGLYNRNVGDEFFNAKVRIGGTLWVGNVVTLLDASDWRPKEQDSKYDNVILVLCHNANAVVVNSKGNSVATVQAQIPENVSRNAETLLGVTGDNVCHTHIMEYTTPLIRHSWLAAVETEFLEEEVDYLSRFYKECGSNLEETFFVALLRAFGFGVNKITMDLIARSISTGMLEHHRDDLFQIEAILMGQAGLLDDIECIPKKWQNVSLTEGYFAKLRNEYLYLRHKYSMKNISRLCWEPYGNGGWSYPHVCLSMLANLYHRRSLDSGIVLETKTAKEFMRHLYTEVTPYWETHNIFGDESKKRMKRLSEDRKAWIIATGIVPFLFFWGRLKQNEELCDRAFEIMEQVKTFSTSATTHFKKVGLSPTDAGECVALTHLRQKYCSPQCFHVDRRLCLQCRFGFEFIRHHEPTLEI